MFLKEQKLEQRIKELSQYRYLKRMDVSKFYFCEEEKGELLKEQSDYHSWEEITLGTKWKGWDKYIWLACDIVIPEHEEGRKVVGRFDFGKTGAGNNSAFESQLYINGSPYQGVDSNHTEVFFQDRLLGKEANLSFRLWSGLDGMLGKYEEQEHILKMAEIAVLDEQTDDLYFNARALKESIDLMGENDSNRVHLLMILDKSFQSIDWSKPGSQRFYQSVYTANDVLLNKLNQLNQEHSVTVTGIGHTHIDVAWLWRLKHTREKCGRSFSTVLRLMEMFPEYTFLQTQPQLYEYVKQDYPEIYEEIKERVKEGRWEAGGGMWLEADSNIPSGESLVRQLLKGQAFFEQEFGAAELKYLWLPDVFGYSWALPQILKKSGIETFMTTKISWNQYNRMPHDTFKWRGIDGSEILTHFITTPDSNNRYTYNGEINARSVEGIWNEYNDKSLNQELLLSYGYGDGGGGVNREMLEMRRRLDKVPGMPNLKTGRADEYFSRLKETVDSTDQYVHTWDGELYLEYHRGTYTSQAYNKKMNRKLELMYREAEMLHVFSALNTKEWSEESQQKLDDGWKIILRNQFHDIIPGSSIHEVYEDSHKEYEEAHTLVSEAVDNLAGSESDYRVFNSSAWTQSNLVCVEGSNSNNGVWKDSSGEQLSAQQEGGNWWVYVKDIPPLSYKSIVFEETAEKGSNEKVFEAGDRHVKTPFYDIEWDEKGHLTTIIDVEHDRQVLAKGKGNVFQVFEDKPLNFDAWDIDIFYQEKTQVIDKLTNVEVKIDGSLRVVVTFTWEYEDSSIQQEMILYKHNRRIDFKTNVDWHESNQLLKVAFPVNVRATEATYDIQFGNVKRPAHWNTSWDLARFETVGHQWADVSERNYGVSLLNDCKYGYDIKDNVMRLSLIKSAVQPDATQDQGEHQFTYSLYPHVGDWYEGGTVKEAWYLNNPLTHKNGVAVDEEKPLFSPNEDNIKVDAVKKAEKSDQVVLRFHEYSGKSSDLTITSGYEIVEWQECDLMEVPVGEARYEPAISTTVSPYEIKTFLVKLK